MAKLSYILFNKYMYVMGPSWWSSAIYLFHNEGLRT